MQVRAGLYRTRDVKDMDGMHSRPDEDIHCLGLPDGEFIPNTRCKGQERMSVGRPIH
jgi:hypothetical protein